MEGFTRPRRADCLRRGARRRLEPETPCPFTKGKGTVVQSVHHNLGHQRNRPFSPAKKDRTSWSPEKRQQGPSELLALRPVSPLHVVEGSLSPLESRPLNRERGTGGARGAGRS